MEESRQTAALFRSYFGRIRAHSLITPGKKRGAMELRFFINRTQLIRQLHPAFMVISKDVSADAMPGGQEHRLYLGGNDKLDRLLPTIDSMVKAGCQWRDIAANLGVSKGWTNKFYNRWKALVSADPTEAPLPADAQVQTDSQASVKEDVA